MSLWKKTKRGEGDINSSQNTHGTSVKSDLARFPYIVPALLCK